MKYIPVNNILLLYSGNPSFCYQGVKTSLEICEQNISCKRKENKELNLSTLREDLKKKTENVVNLVKRWVGDKPKSQFLYRLN